MRYFTTLVMFLTLNFHTVSAQNSQENYKEKLIGKWIISKTIITTSSVKEKIEEIETVCNACPKVTFIIEQNAIVKNPSGRQETYVWRIKNDKISFVNIGAAKLDSETFYTEFEMEFTQKKGFLELKLIDRAKNFSYILKKY